MDYFKSFSQALKSMKAGDFEEMALELFQWQALHCPVYAAYIKHRGLRPGHIRVLEEIPFMPISFFKTHKVYCGGQGEVEGYFSSSGTSGSETSKHYYWSMDFYLDHSRRLFEKAYGPLGDFHILALLPAYLERKGSSLIAMVDHFIQLSNSAHSGFYLNEHKELCDLINLLCGDGRKVLLIGVSFALLDLAESNHQLNSYPELLIMETGGMKGRRREMIREELHARLTAAFGVAQIHSEYGMTELMSQAYSYGEGLFSLPPGMRAFVRDSYDPYSLVGQERVGPLNLIDLANFHSCAFIATQDLGRLHADGKVEILGRMDNSDIRGCNLMVSG
jgi:phenylacetate-coenzyme A ligase PaaK-like adenylate-forming protein